MEPDDNVSLIASLAVTGGPGGGKTTLLPMLEHHASNLGWHVQMLEEPATALFKQCDGLKNLFINACVAEDFALVTNIEEEISRFSLQAFRRAHSLARIMGGRWLVLLDRAIPDNRVYLPTGSRGTLMYEDIYHRLGFSSEWEILNLYSGVLKLTTTADGAEEYFVRHEHRPETLEEARILDRRIEEVYDPHDMLCVADNSTGFEEKIRRSMRFLEWVLDSVLAMQ